jgi:hypothetical protein
MNSKSDFNDLQPHSNLSGRRFVVLSHQLPETEHRLNHWDLMLEFNGQLETWALDGLPQAGQTVQAQKLSAHRTAYLDYEGPVSGDRGSVTRVLSGRFEGDVENLAGGESADIYLDADPPLSASFRLIGGTAWSISFHAIIQ